MVGMDRDPSALNDKRTAVLRWVTDGCPSGVYTQGYEHRVVARALQRRGLITITGRGLTRGAKATKRGLDLQAEAARKPSLPQPSEADELIERVLDASGRLVLELDYEGIAKHGPSVEPQGFETRPVSSTTNSR
jgi:hypothetical protein